MDLDPKDADCYWKLLLCKKRVTKNSTLIQLYLDNPYGRVEFVDYPEYKNALRFADSNEREEYLTVVHQIESLRPTIQKQKEEQIKSEWKAEREQFESKYDDRIQRFKQMFLNWKVGLSFGIAFLLFIIVALSETLSK